MERSVEDIKNKIDIVDFIGSYVTLKKRGKHYIGLCPFHQEQTPSFTVSAERQMWYCFGVCKEGGDVVSFLMKYDNISFREALQELARIAGIKIESLTISDSKSDKREKIYTVNRLAAKFYHYILTQTALGTQAMDYLHGRKLTKEMIELFEIGYAPDSWDSLCLFLKKKNVNEQDMVESGLVGKGKNRRYDRFRGRIMFPIKDTRDNIIGFSGRLLKDTTDEAKYINTPETVLYRKRESLYGIHAVKDHIRKTQEVLLTEGEFDMLTPYQYGIRNVVAIKGSAVTEEQLRILKRYTKKIVLSLDADEAGVEAAIRSIRASQELDLDVYVMHVPNGKDPDEAVRANIRQFQQAIKAARPIYDFLIDTVFTKYPSNNAFEKKQITEELVPYLQLIKNPIVLAHYKRLVADRLNVDEYTIAKAMRYKRASSRVSKTNDHKQQEDPSIAREKYVLSVLFQHDNPYDIYSKQYTDLDIFDFSLPALAKLYEYFIEFKDNGRKWSVNEFLSYVPAELHPMFDELFLRMDFGITPDETISTIIIRIKTNVIRKKIDKLLKDEKEDHDKEIQQLNTFLTSLEKKHNML